MSNFYDSTLPVIIHKLGNLKHICEVGAKHAADLNIEETSLTGFRLYPDMLPFTSQINICTDILCGMTARLTGVERFKLDDEVTSFDELIARIDKTIEHLESQNRRDYQGAESKEVVLQTPVGDLKFTGNEYIANFVFPNLYFHITTAYNILRNNGVKLGKSDYLKGAG